MKEIAGMVNRDRSDKDSVLARKVGWIVYNALKLKKDNRRNVQHLIWNQAKIDKLCEKYGVIPPGCEDVSFVSDDDHLDWDNIPDLPREKP